MNLRFLYLYENVSLMLQVAAWWLDGNSPNSLLLFYFVCHINPRIFGQTCCFLTATQTQTAIYFLHSLPPPLRAAGVCWSQSHLDIHTLTHLQTFGLTCMFPDCGWKQENLQRTQQLQGDWPQTYDSTSNLLAVRQQCYVR